MEKIQLQRQRFESNPNMIVLLLYNYNMLYETALI